MRKSKLKYILLVIMTFFISMQPVFAKNEYDWGTKLEYIQCGESAIPAPIPGITRVIIILLKLVLPLVIIILGLLDFTKATMASNEEGIKKAQNQFIKRIIVAGIFFMVITLVQFAVNIVTKDTKDGGIGQCINCLISGNECQGTGESPFKPTD